MSEKVLAKLLSPVQTFQFAEFDISFPKMVVHNTQIRMKAEIIFNKYLTITANLFVQISSTIRKRKKESMYVYIP